MGCRLLSLRSPLARSSLSLRLARVVQLVLLAVDLAVWTQRSLASSDSIWSSRVASMSVSIGIKASSHGEVVEKGLLGSRSWPHRLI